MLKLKKQNDERDEKYFLQLNELQFSNTIKKERTTNILNKTKFR